jgi:hypothetical protein
VVHTTVRRAWATSAPLDCLCEQPRHLGAQHSARGPLRSLVIGAVRAVMLDHPEPLVTNRALVGMLELLCLALKCFRSESLVLSSFGQCGHGNWPLGACVWVCLRIAAPFRNALPQSEHDTGAAIVLSREGEKTKVGAFSQNAPTFHDWVDLTSDLR